MSIGISEQLDLVAGAPCWQHEPWDYGDSDPLPDAKVDVAIVGCGISGAMVGQRLAEEGYRVALVDRRKPAFGSTVASTAMVHSYISQE